MSTEKAVQDEISLLKAIFEWRRYKKDNINNSNNSNNSNNYNISDIDELIKSSFLKVPLQNLWLNEVTIKDFDLFKTFLKENKDKYGFIK